VRARKLVLGGLIAVMLLGLVGCGDDGDDDEDEVLGARAETADLVVQDEFPFYEPTGLRIPANQEVTLTVFNDGERIHNITVPGFTIDMDVAPGQTVEIKLPAASVPRDGFYLFYCKYHQSEGEAGRINIAG
jgi:plastocyanin